MKSVNASSDREADCVVPEPDQGYFSGRVDGLQMTASS